MKYLIILILIFLITGIFLPRDFNSDKNIIFRIERSQGSGDIAVNLAKNDLIWWSPLFRAYSIFRGRADNLQAGCYFLSPSMNILKITETLSSGLIAKEKITIPEGFTSAQITERMQDVTRSDSITLSDYEGYLFPDTYEIPYCMEQEEIIKMMTNNFNRKTVGLKITSEIIIMASLLEKEVKTKEEKELAAGVLWKRLRAGIPLQVDAAIWTYKNYGLPPKPIANPGLESILAALYPKESSYWYYLSKPDGQTIFNKTLKEHNIAKAKYLQGLTGK